MVRTTSNTGPPNHDPRLGPPRGAANPDFPGGGGGYQRRGPPPTRWNVDQLVQATIRLMGLNHSMVRDILIQICILVAGLIFVLSGDLGSAGICLLLYYTWYLYLQLTYGLARHLFDPPPPGQGLRAPLLTESERQQYAQQDQDQASEQPPTQPTQPHPPSDTTEPAAPNLPFPTNGNPAVTATNTV
ncbi:unnamed protein product [Amoebophrya sp. A120]|nr:unnamed protein product [Amoebophrya sp. A120]|eukprot:GSA120T00025249001.1